MNIDKTAELLAEIQLIDNRHVDEEVIVSWHELVGDLDFSIAREAVILHRRERTEWMTPAHVRENVERIRVAGVGELEDDFGNRVMPDAAALATFQRINRLKGIEA